MERDFRPENMVENSTISMLQAMADNKPEEFLKLLDNSKGGAPFDEETTEKFKRLGILDPAGNIEENVRRQLLRIDYREKQ